MLNLSYINVHNQHICAHYLITRSINFVLPKIFNHTHITNCATMCICVNYFLYHNIAYKSISKVSSKKFDIYAFLFIECALLIKPTQLKPLRPSVTNMFPNNKKRLLLLSIPVSIRSIYPGGVECVVVSFNFNYSQCKRFFNTYLC